MNPNPPAPLATTGLQVADYLVVTAYMVLLLGVGVYLGRKQETTEDYFVGGRNMPWWAVGVSMLATLMSTLTYLGFPGELIQHGMGQAIGLICLPFAFVVVGYVWVPFFMRLGLTSAYEYLERRFGTKTRFLGAWLFLYMRLVWMGAIVFTASRALALMTAATGPKALAVLTGQAVQLDDRGWFYMVLVGTCVVSTLYTALGGIRAVIWTDVIQFLVLASGAVLTILIIAARTGTGPAEWWRETTRVAHKLPPLASWDLSLRVTVLWTVLAGFFWNVCTHASDQVALQRYFSTRDAAAARRTAALSYVLNIGVEIVLVLVGMALLTYYLRHPDQLPSGVDDPRSPAFADQIFPHFIVHGLPVGVSGLVIAAVFAVAQSSVDSGINSVATVLLVDLLRKRKRHDSTARAELHQARWLTLAIGLAVTIMGLLINFLPDRYNIIDLTLKSFNLVLGPMGAIFMAGILLPQVGEAAVLIAGLIGVVTGALFAFGDLVPGWAGPSPYLVVPLSWLSTFVLASLLGGLLPGPRPEQTEGLTWRSVMTRRRLEEAR